MAALQIYSLDDENENAVISTFYEGEHFIGRDKLNCKDKRISRNHAIITVSKNEVRLKSTHVNPSFYKPCGGNSIKLIKTDETVVINDGDQFGFLADACWFKTRVVECNNGNKRPCHSLEPEDDIKKVKISEDEDSLPNVQDKPIDSVSKIAESNSDNSIDFADDLLKSKEQQNLLEPDIPITDDKNGQLEENVTTEVDTNVNNTSELDEDIDNNESVDKELNKPNDSTSNKDDLPKKKTKQKCWYGATCYRKNISHKQEFSHPGDSDFDDNDVPDCPFGSACYRTNMLHRQQYKHSNPPAPKHAVNPNAANTSKINSDDEDSSDNNTSGKKRRKAATKVKYTDTPEDDYDLEDPFINDGSSDDYEASDDDDTDSDWQDSQEVEEESQERKRLLKEAKRFTKKKKQK